MQAAGHKKRGHPNKQKWSKKKKQRNGDSVERNSDGRPTKQTAPAVIVRNPESRTSSTTLSQLTSNKFADQKISSQAKEALRTVLGYECMTKVQAETLAVALEGHDLLAKAKTGTGKTLAFLLPAVELASRSRQHGRIAVLVVSPTRELAQQILAEARQLCSKMALTMQCVVGGTNIKKDQSAFKKTMPDLLVGTPGRLLDHLQNSPPIKAAITGLRCLILDEADQLLEMGFRKDITKLLGLLPHNQHRQTLLFSATMPKDVMSIAQLALKKDFKHVDCVGKEQNTHQHVPQSVVVYPQGAWASFAHLASLLHRAVAQHPDTHKIMVFFTTARLTGLFSTVFNALKGRPFGEVLEIHSRKSQGQRTKTSARFRNCPAGIMFTSDVTARGMDYPDVTAVVQVGLPQDKAQYVHRLGRTARAGKQGVGVLLIAKYEEPFLLRVQDQGVAKETVAVAEAGKWAPQMASAARAVDAVLWQQAYQAWLGFYNGNLKILKWNKKEMVRRANEWIVDECERDYAPSIPDKTLGKMGLRGVPGIN